MILKRNTILKILTTLIFLLVITSFSIGQEMKATCQQNTLYVGGEGTQNYTKIQDAINDSENGNNIFVYNGTYYEHIVVNKSVSIIGESKNGAIIDAGKIGHAVIITAKNVKIMNFTIQNSGPDEWDAAVKVMANNSIIQNNLLINNTDGISLIPSSHSRIVNNQIIGGLAGIDVYGLGIDAVNNTIEGNTIKNIDYAIWIGFAYDTKVINNDLVENKYAIMMEDSEDNLFSRNNFRDNDLNARFTNISKNKWKNNYWDRGRLLPYVIFGAKHGKILNIPMINIDWRPALKPYCMDCECID